MSSSAPLAVALPDLTGRVVVVTGANAGIGLATSTALAGAGARVVMAVRDPAKGRAAAAGIAGQVEVHQLDLADLRSIRAFADAWDEPLDILINNAGVSPADLQRTTDGFEAQIGTNHLGHFALTNLLLEHVTDRVVTLASQAERAGRIDFDDLNFERRPYKASRAYNQSKLANLLFTAELQRRLDTTGSPVRALGAHPGFVATNMVADSGPVNRTLMRLLAQSPQEGALSTLYAATAALPGDSFAGPSRLMHMRGAPMLINRSARARDAELARKLWDVSERLTAVSFPLRHAPAPVTVPAR